MRDNELRKLDFLTQEILFEHERQIAKWGIQDRSSFEWMAYLTEEIGELAQAICEYEYRKGRTSNIFKEAMQVATLSLKIAEMSRGISDPKEEINP